MPLTRFYTSISIQWPAYALEYLCLHLRANVSASRTTDAVTGHSKVSAAASFVDSSLEIPGAPEKFCAACGSSAAPKLPTVAAEVLFCSCSSSRISGGSLPCRHKNERPIVKPLISRTRRKQPDRRCQPWYGTFRRTAVLSLNHS